jgi:RNA polymerase sigma factor (sigma-70 family)
MAFVLKNGGTSEDARDVFQDALVIIYKKAQREDFELTSQFYTYLFGVCNNVWRKKREKKVNNPVTISDEEGYIDETGGVEQILEQRERYKLYKDAFERLSNGCKTLLQLFYQKETMKNIAEVLQLTSADAAKTRKMRCQKELEKLMRQAPKFKELSNTK